jgi:hypothetical protein
VPSSVHIRMTLRGAVARARAAHKFLTVSLPALSTPQRLALGSDAPQRPSPRRRRPSLDVRLFCRKVSRGFGAAVPR